MPPGRLVHATVLLISIHVTLVSPSPAPASSVQSSADPTEASRVLQSRQNPPPDAGNQVYHLPPVEDVFKMVADAESRNGAAGPHPAQTPAPMIAAALSPGVAPATTTQPLADATHYGPGLVVVPSSSVDPQSTAPPAASQSAVPPVVEPTVNGPSEHISTPARQLILIGIVMGALVLLVFLVYVFLDRRVLAACAGKKKKNDSEGSWTKIKSPPPPPPSFQDSEKDVILYTPPWMESSSISEGSRDSSAGPHTPLHVQVARNECKAGKVLDIGPNDPRSKFSVTSSDYPYSLSSARSSVPAADPEPEHEHSMTSPLLPAYEFFCLPGNGNSTDSESFEDHEHEQRHSRAHSVPIFGHAASRGVMVRAPQHRRSRSISGLTYTVPGERRESGSSVGDCSSWRGTPQMDHGWPSAL
ncbi:hypothetical protein LshimejAT787_1101630 [Lyophyllum shimeji]|uniref:Transmembrane protein n=1 Tax=Lyophyllum shimeji TaxID=47721 RepID=A0A9P3PUA3_LYOSH|nr:hypothetical protein LshimejAT787_1101630 [Lyophyllum shimeji]